jgi:hypothetical protein
MARGGESQPTSELTLSTLGASHDELCGRVESIGTDWLSHCSCGEHTVRRNASLTLWEGLCLHLAGGRSPAARNRLVARVPARAAANHRSSWACQSAARSPTNAPVWALVTLRNCHGGVIGGCSMGSAASPTLLLAPSVGWAVPCLKRVQ